MGLGSLNDIPEATARNLKAAISKALTSSQPQRSLRRNLINFARQEGLGELTDVSSSATQDDYRSLSEAGINSVVEVAVFEVWLAGKKRGDPKLVFGVRAYVRVVRTQDNSEVTSKFTLTYSGPIRKFTAWGANQAHAFRRELHRAYGELAQMIVTRVFLEVR